MKDEQLPYGASPDAARRLYETGLLGEINRVVLHPFGLALSVATNEAGEVLGFGPLLQAPEDDDEGYVFDEETLQMAQEKLQRFLDEEGMAQLDRRLDARGSLIQGSWLW